MSQAPRYRRCLTELLAAWVRFELTERFPVRRFSRPLHSTTLPPRPGPESSSNPASNASGRLEAPAIQQEFQGEVSTWQVLAPSPTVSPDRHLSCNSDDQNSIRDGPRSERD